jgi:hypothetical protein
LPYELRRLAAFKADVLTALARIFVEAIFAGYRARAKRDGIGTGECGSVNDALIEPILQRRTSFVLGSRSLGLDDWKVRRFEGNVVKRFLLNAAQVGFAKTFNVLYQQNVTDVNTMFKVFRSECLEGLNLESDGFNLDIELACKLVKNGNAPMEVPVNYVARGFDEGKKISFVRDAFPSYAAFFKWRFKR